MKVALVSDIPAGAPLAGPHRTTKGLAEALANRGIDVTVVGYRGDPTLLDVPAVVLTNDIPSFNLSMIRFQRDVLRFVSSNEFDVVHAWEPVLPFPDIQSSIDLFSIHGVAYAEETPLSPPPTQRIAALVHTLQAAVTSRTTPTVAQSTRTESDAQRFGFSVDGRIPVGIEPRFFQSSRGEDGRILYVSRVNEHKNQSELVSAARHAGWNLRLVGTLDDSAYANSIPEFERYYRGEISDRELLEEYARAQVYVLPSRHEGFGLTGLEAMAAETPVIASDQCGICDVISEGKNGGIYRQGDTDDLIAKVKQALINSHYLGRKARRTAEGLTWDEIAAKYIRTYEALC